jgi:hypothetical protein
MNGQICLKSKLTKEQHLQWINYMMVKIDPFINKRHKYVIVEIDGIHYDEGFDIIKDFILFPDKISNDILLVDIFNNAKYFCIYLAVYKYIDAYFDQNKVANNLAMNNFIKKWMSLQHLYDLAKQLINGNIKIIRNLIGCPIALENEMKSKFHNLTGVHFSLFYIPNAICILGLCDCKQTSALPYIEKMYPDMFLIPNFGPECITIYTKINSIQYIENYTNESLLSLYQMGICKFLKTYTKFI